MENNNPYKRSFKTKREEYQDKLLQKSTNQDWIFGNVFGKQGGGAPLRDNQGNIISSLKTITNNNIHHYEAKDFTKGDYNISVINHKIYNQNKILSSPPFYPINNADNYYQNKNNISQNNITISSNNLYSNRETQKIDSKTANGNNDILIQKLIPNVYIIPYTNIIPYRSNSSIQFQNSNNNLNFFNHINMNNQSFIQKQFSPVTPKINYLNESQSKLNNSSFNNNQENLSQKNSSLNNSNINKNKKENNFILISNDIDLNNKIQNEKKLEEWKNDLKNQVEEKKKRVEEAKKELERKDEEEKIKYQEYLEYKNKQAEEQNKKNKLKRKNYMNKNNNILEMSNNDLEKSNQTISDIQNKNNNIQNPYNQNNLLNDYNMSPEILKEQENFKNYISQQFETLGESLGQNIHNEIMKNTSNINNKYEPFSNNEYFKNANKFNNESAVKIDKKMQKIQDIIEERELLDFIIGQKEIFSPFKYKNYDINKYDKNYKENISYFGTNKNSNEKRFVNLDSSSKFLYGDYYNHNKSKEYKEYEKEKNNTIDDNINNNKSRIFGKNKENIEIQESIGVSQSLDNKTSFIPIINEEEKEIPKKNENLDNKKIIKEVIVKEDNKISDKLEDNIIKNLNEINVLNKNVILYNKEENITKNNKKNNENIYQQKNVEIKEKGIKNEIEDNNITKNSEKKELKIGKTGIEETNINLNNSINEGNKNENIFDRDEKNKLESQVKSLNNNQESEVGVQSENID